MERECKIEVIPGYSETDQMGFVHHSNYVKYFETARWELFRALAIPYKSIEEMGFLLPVIKMEMEFIKPAFYDEKLEIAVSAYLIDNSKLRFDYTINGAAGETITRAYTILAVIKKENKKATRIPSFITEKFRD